MSRLQKRDGPFGRCPRCGGGHPQYGVTCPMSPYDYQRDLVTDGRKPGKPTEPRLRTPPYRPPRPGPFDSPWVRSVVRFVGGPVDGCIMPRFGLDHLRVYRFRMFLHPTQDPSECVYVRRGEDEDFEWHGFAHELESHLATEEGKKAQAVWDAIPTEEEAKRGKWDGLRKMAEQGDVGGVRSFLDSSKNHLLLADIEELRASIRMSSLADLNDAILGLDQRLVPLRTKVVT